MGGPGSSEARTLQLYARSIQLRHWLHPCPRQHYLTRSQSCPPYVVRLALRQRAHQACQLAAEASSHAGQHERALAARLQGRWAKQASLAQRLGAASHPQLCRQQIAESREQVPRVQPAGRQVWRTLTSFFGLGSSLAAEEVRESAAAPPAAAAAASAAKSSRMMVTLLLPSRWACSATTKS